MLATSPGGSFVSLRDYAGSYEFGESGASEVNNLKKALSAGADINNPGVSAGQGFPLRVESLEATLKNTTWEMDEIKLFKAIPKLPATNTVEEFNRLLSYGSAPVGRQFHQGWMSEGDLPTEEDSTYERAYVPVKFLGVTGRVTHVANTIKAAHGSVIAMETMNKTMHLLNILESTLFFGDSSVHSFEFDGLEKLIVDGSSGDNVVDLRGGVLTEKVMNDSLLLIRRNFGRGTDFYFNAGPFADLANQVYDRQRYGVAPSPGVLGTEIRAFQGQHGKVDLHDSVFIAESDVAVDAGSGNATTRPATPTIAVAPAAGSSGSQFATADAGTYIYRVVALNRFGGSVPVNTAGVAVTVGQQVTFTIQDSGGGAGTAFYEIYRTAAGGAASTAKLIKRVARSGSTQVFTDTNADIPGTSKGFGLMQNQRSFSWAQLLPMTRIPLATIDTSIRWSQVLYGAIKMYTPRKNILFKNIGRAA